MRLPAALVISVLIWSSARYLPPYFLEMHKMDMEEERAVTDVHTQTSALLRKMHLKLPQTEAAKPAPEPAKRFY